LLRAERNELLWGSVHFTVFVTGYGLYPSISCRVKLNISLITLRLRKLDARYAASHCGDRELCHPFHGSGRVIRGLLGDWQVNALAFWQTGSPFAITSNVTQNLSLFKTLPIHENLALRLRAECLNISNTPNFAQPSGAINSYASTPDTNGNYVATGAGNFGISTSTAPGSSARQYQFAAKITF
jgi:hypothetical protein